MTLLPEELFKELTKFNAKTYERKYNRTYTKLNL